MFIINYNFKIIKYINMFFCNYRSLIFIKTFLGVIYFKLSPLYFYKYYKNIKKFIFLSRYFYSVVLKFFSISINSKIKFFFSKLWIKGLGFRIKLISKNLYRFFFDSINFFYFHIPLSILVRLRKKHLLLVSNSLKELKIITLLLLLLRKINIYKSGGLLFPRKIIFFKSSKKKL